jgi:hypothetical protein
MKFQNKNDVEALADNSEAPDPQIFDARKSDKAITIAVPFGSINVEKGTYIFSIDSVDQFAVHPDDIDANWVHIK